MRRTMILALGLLMVPGVAAAQVELGLDGGLVYSDVDGVADASFGISLPTSGARVAFMGGEQLIIETRLQFDWEKAGDDSATLLGLVPGVNFMVTPQVYIRGEAGLSYFKVDQGAFSGSGTQYLFGGGVGTRRALGSGAVLRLEAGVEKGLENTDDNIASHLNIHGTVGVSAIIGG